MSAATRSASVTVGTAPSWWLSKPDLRWFKLADGTGSGFSGGSTIYQVRAVPEPGGTYPNPGVFAYSGGAVDQDRGKMYVHGGGHGSYNGNEVYGLCVRDEVPAWGKMCDPSAGALIGGSPLKNITGQFDADVGYSGAPASSHTYNNMQVANNRLWLLKVAAMGSGVQGAARVFWFDLKTNKWTAGPFWLPRQQSDLYNIGFAEAGATVYVPGENAFYLEGINLGGGAPDNTPVVYKLDGNTGAVIKSWGWPQFTGLGVGNSATISSTRFVVWSEYTSPNVNFYETSSGDLVRTSKAITNNTGTSDWFGQSRGGAYHAASNALICNVAGGEDLIVVRIPSNPVTGTWIADRVHPENYSDPARIIPPTYNYNYGRWNVIQEMGDGRSALLYMPETVSGPAYIMPLPAAGV